MSELTHWNTMVSQGKRKQVSVRIAIRQKAELEREAEERGVSRSEYMREILDERSRVDELEERVERKQNRIDELEEQLTARSQIEEKIENLPDKIRGDRSYQDRRQKKLDEGSVTQRLVWKVTGVPVDRNE
jgi:Ribbon-helix-helix protein, copG family.